MFRNLLLISGLALLPTLAFANPTQETRENEFLDLVDGQGNALVQGKGVEGVNAKARSQGLRFPALGYWSPENHCFTKPAAGECNGVFKK